MSDRERSTDGIRDVVGDDGGTATNAAEATDGSDRTGEGRPAGSAEFGAETADADVDADALRARARRLEAENRRLREQYVSVRTRRYRRTAVGLGVVGLAFGAAGLVVGSAREVLFALAAVGLFGAVLTRYLTPERFIPLDVGEGIYATMADNEAAVAEQLGLSSTRVYVATDQGPRLFVPEIDAYDEALLTEAEADGDGDPLARPLVVGDRAARSGLAVRPVAAALLDAFDRQHSGPLSAVPREAVSSLREGVTDALELAGGADTDLDAADGRVTVAVLDPLYGDLTRFDHPIASFLGSGLARALGTPVTVDVVVTVTDGEETPLVTCRWDPDGVVAETADGDEGGDVSGERDAAAPDDAGGRTSDDR